jgi:GH15 family glucan-1,4-alpha-glucosidase
VLMLLAAAARHDRLDRDGWQAMETAVAVIRARGGDPDAGIWELDEQRWAHSRLTCVAGLRAAAAAAPAAQGAAWSGFADTLLAEVTADCLHPSGRWQRAPDDDRMDAALLLPVLRGAVPPADPRALATLDAARAELSCDGYMYRFRPDDRPLGQAEGAFLLCGFTMALALHQQGREVEAARWFERNRAACGPPGLLTEEYDITQRQVRGNAPQAFVHALLLEAAQRLATPDPSAASHPSRES